MTEAASNKKRLYFVSLKLSHTVHMVGLGFTDHIYLYVECRERTDVQEIVEAYYSGVVDYQSQEPIVFLATSAMDITNNQRQPLTSSIIRAGDRYAGDKGLRKTDFP